MNEILQNPRFAGIKPLSTKLWLASPIMHGAELDGTDNASASNWGSTVVTDIDNIERDFAALVGVRYATWRFPAAPRAVELATEHLYGQAGPSTERFMTPAQQDVVIDIIHRCFK